MLAITFKIKEIFTSNYLTKSGWYLTQLTPKLQSYRNQSIENKIEKIREKCVNFPLKNFAIPQ